MLHKNNVRTSPPCRNLKVPRHTVWYSTCLGQPGLTENVSRTFSTLFNQSVRLYVTKITFIKCSEMPCNNV